MKGKLGYLQVILMIGCIPLTVAIMAITIYSAGKMKSELIDSTYLRLKACTTSVEQYFTWDIREDILERDEISYQFIDSLKADDIEQTLLSAKHSLFTNTAEIKFSDNFDRYFINDTCQIRFNDEMIELSSEEPEEFSHYYLEFHLSEMTKHQDGEARQYDRGINEILVYDDRDESKDSITELNGSQLYLSRELVEYYFLDAMRHATTDIVRIPFSDLIDTGKPTIDIVFEYQFKNSELADAIVKLTNILGNGEAIAMYETYEDCLNGIIPLFRKGGITKLHEVHFELIVSQLICDEDGGLVDWTEENPSYKFRSMTKAILANQSVTASLIARESSKQIAGAYGTYEKHGVSDYDAFLLDTSKLKDNDDDDERVDLNEFDDDELDRVRGILDDLIEEEKR